MEILKVPHLLIASGDDIQQISMQLDLLKGNMLQHLLWPTSFYKPKVQFYIGHTDGSILLKYKVQEKYLRACNISDNSRVYLDSCVEFFISFNNEKSYYNLEFNCLGTCLAAFGDNRDNRELLPTETILQIKRQATINNIIDEGSGNAHWELTVIIPLTIFIHHNFSSLKGLHCSGNFYKCGDDLPMPHYLSWKEVKSANPNFHLPEYFGSLQFV